MPHRLQRERLGGNELILSFITLQLLVVFNCSVNSATTETVKVIRIMIKIRSDIYAALNCYS
jgi:hypothetical protein